MQRKTCLLGQVVVRGVMRHAVLKVKSVVVTGRFHGTVEAATLEVMVCSIDRVTCSADQRKHISLWKQQSGQSPKMKIK